MNRMDKKPRIAFCFSWQARTLDQTYIFFQRNLFDTAREQWFNYDVFCAVEDDEDVDKVKLLNPTKVEKIKTNNVEKIIEKKYWELFNNSMEISQNCYLFNNQYFILLDKNKVYNFLQQIYKVSQSFLISKQSKENYDIVLRLRFDTFFLNKLNFHKITEYINDKKIILCNSYERIRFKKFYQIEDLFFIWNKFLADSLEEIFINFLDPLKWDEIKNKHILNIFSLIRKCINKINTGLNIKLPTYPILCVESLFYKIFSPEGCYYNFFIKKGFNIKTYKFSHILLRKDWSTSYIKIEKNKAFFEI